ncbi:hypothetical protein B5807_00402 [Epicoccum nigrum]|uniref:Uncharacterized protein n=1 Tax=Epicoccum nigrum TaxID=105696 RepID=A0A1Y2MGT6_EPING|nr:hypothetical protein B5807_00402 [Epicoccum nigrum]
MSHLTPPSSRKRPSLDEEASTSDLSTYTAGSAKRQCTSLPEKVPSSSLRLLITGKDIPWELPSKTVPSSGLRLLIPKEEAPPTPPSSITAAATMALKLTIPREQTTRDELAKVNRHKSDAERWKPKLQRPYPRQSEIKRAYPLKLLRHYPDSTVQPQPDFQRPKIDKSPRVSRLLQQFPLLETNKKRTLTIIYPSPDPATPASLAIPLSALREDLSYTRLANPELQWNQYLTQTDHARYWAWQAFSLPELDRVDRGREAMVHSGLDEVDLQRENHGWPNGLPDWKRPWTGRFAAGAAGWPETPMHFFYM